MKLTTIRSIHPATTIAVSLIAMVFSAPSRGQVILDQSNLAPTKTSTATNSIDYVFDQAQTFTAAISGKLARIEVAVFYQPQSNFDFLFELRRTEANGAPVISSDGLLYSETISASRIPSMDQINELVPFNTISVNPLGANIDIHAGDMLAIVLRSPLAGYGGAANIWTCADDVTDPYPDGRNYSRFLGSPWFDWDSTGLGRYYDMHFSEYVMIPEPNTIALLATACIGFCTRRRKSIAQNCA